MRAPLLFLLGLATPALAQQASPASAVSPAASIQQAKADIAEIIGHRDAVNERMDALLKSGKTEEARCMVGPANALRALAEVSDGAFVAMNKAFAEGEDARGEYEGRKIGVATAKARQLRAQADACEGKDNGVIERFYAEGGAEDAEQIDAGNVDIGDDPPNTTPFE